MPYPHGAPPPRTVLFSGQHGLAEKWRFLGDPGNPQRLLGCCWHLVTMGVRITPWRAMQHNLCPLNGVYRLLKSAVGAGYGYTNIFVPSGPPPLPVRYRPATTQSSGPAHLHPSASHQDWLPKQGRRLNARESSGCLISGSTHLLVFCEGVAPDCGCLGWGGA